VAAAAARHRLRLVVPDEAARRYVATGNLTESGWPPGWWKASPRPLRDRVIAVDIGRAATEAAVKRLAEIAARYASDPAMPPVFAETASEPVEAVTFLALCPGAVPVTDTAQGRAARGAVRPEEAGAAEPQGGGVLLTLRCERGREEESAAAIQRWRWRFHGGLADGHTAGLIIDRYWTAPGDERALADADGAVTVERINAVSKLASRMARWGPLLRRLDVEPFPWPLGVPASLQMTLFASERRRALLVWNRSQTEYLRTTLSLPAQIGGQPAGRLVEVPDDINASPGAVLEPRGGQITLPLFIAPGDAKLFEVF
jgi:hypothetical protein